MNNVEQRLRAYIQQLEAEAGKSSNVKIKQKNRAAPCFVLFGVLMCVLLLAKRKDK